MKAATSNNTIIVNQETALVGLKITIYPASKRQAFAGQLPHDIE
eukprot:CAMPEP_0196804856 /NCGR_PEP_ID=MMETSP1362-20130617/4532_1 /TAXON_ID=163516 /ORGANISM="Leptocylindrus danicus, Strain CCMP1856" /LENGTH=43 /DNA_ID= /DNA_START= /DNA_END= /DNA_ORIENTATION=